MTIAQTLREAAATLGATSETPRLDAELLMAHALGTSRSELLLRHQSAPVPASFAPLLTRRRTHEPIAYIVGAQEFYGLEFQVTPAVLIPRGDSEVLIDAARADLAERPPATILDLGTGSGALLMAALTVWPKASGMGIERSLGALAVAASNAARLGLAERARMLRGDWEQPDWASDLGHFDLILVNPPYVEAEAQLATSVRDHEPAGALFAGAEGLDAYRVLIPQLPGLLAPGGLIMVEIGATQTGAVSAIAHQNGFAVTIHRDLGANPRALALKIPLGF